MMDSSIWVVAIVAAVVLILTVLLFCKAWFILRRNGHPSFLYSHRAATTAMPYHAHLGPIGSSRGALTLPTQHLHLNSTAARRPIQVTSIVEPTPSPAVIDYSSIYSVHSQSSLPNQTTQTQTTTTTSQLHSGFLNLGYQEETVGTSITVELDETSSVRVPVAVPVPSARDYCEFDPPPSYREAIFLNSRNHHHNHHQQQEQQKDKKKSKGSC